MEHTSTLSPVIENPSVKFSGAGNNKEKKIYGLELVLELFDCDLEKLTSINQVEEFLDKLEKEGGLTTYGAPLIKRFMGGGHFGEGYSFLQFLSSSSIAGHYIEGDRVVFLNVFSCSMFNAD